jgi:chromosome segregation ATPase
VTDLLSLFESGGVKALIAAVIGGILLKSFEFLTSWIREYRDRKKKGDEDYNKLMRDDNQDFRHSLMETNRELRIQIDAVEKEVSAWRDKYYRLLQATLDLRTRFIVPREKWMTLRENPSEDDEVKFDHENTLNEMSLDISVIDREIPEMPPPSSESPTPIPPVMRGPDKVSDKK